MLQELAVLKDNMNLQLPPSLYCRHYSFPNKLQSTGLKPYSILVINLAPS